MSLDSLISQIRKDKMNEICFDCGAQNPVFISINNGIFLCAQCATVHMSFQPGVSTVENNDLSTIISNVLSSQLIALKENNWDDLTDVDFPEFKGRDENNKLTLNDYLKDFQPVVFETENSKDTEIGKATFSEPIIREALEKLRKEAV